MKRDKEMNLKPEFYSIRMVNSLKLVAFLLLCGCANMSGNFLHKNSEIKIMSFNIRCGVCEEESDANHWSKRKILVEKVLQSEMPDIIATQESEDYQAEDMAKMTGFSYYGIGREEGQTGERNAILWNTKRFSALKTETIWLNPEFKPFERGWDADWIRTLTMVKFQEIKTGKVFWVFDAHLDNAGKTARLEGANIILNQIKLREGEKVILLGDLNDVQSSQSYLVLARKLTAVSHYAPEDFTFNGFGKDMKKGHSIDHIFVNFKTKAKGFKIITNTYDGLFPSDHFPIIVGLSL